MYKIVGGDQNEYQASSLDELKEWIDEGRVGKQTFVTGPHSSGWKRACEYVELSECFRMGTPFAQQVLEQNRPFVENPSRDQSEVAGCDHRHRPGVVDHCTNGDSHTLPVVHIGDALPVTDLTTATKENCSMHSQQETKAPNSVDKATPLDITLAFVPLIGPFVGLIGIYHVFRGRPKRGGTMLGCACLGMVILRLVVMHMTGDTEFWWF